MDLNRLTNDKKLNLCRWYFKDISKVKPNPYRQLDKSLSQGVICNCQSACSAWQSRMSKPTTDATMYVVRGPGSAADLNILMMMISVKKKGVDLAMIDVITVTVGCVLLPFVWAVNAVWFFKEAFIKPPYDEQKLIRKYVIMSGIGALVWAIVLAAWVTTYQLNRVSWGETGDALSFLVPMGRA